MRIDSAFDKHQSLYVECSHFKEGIWIGCGNNWFHYANDNYGHAIISREEAKTFAEAILKLVAEPENETE